jgi:hypothetical protein
VVELRTSGKIKKVFKKTFLIAFGTFLLMQLYQPVRSTYYEPVPPEYFTNIYTVPAKVEIILKTSCYDCHSNNTNHPWYSKIQPLRMLIDGHINEAWENLNFSDWGSYSSRKQGNKLDRISKQIKSDEMPLFSYTLIHRDAILTTTQKEELIHWIDKVKDSLSLKH